MPWSERQREMLGAMGLRVWSAPAVGLPVPSAVDEAQSRAAELPARGEGSRPEPMVRQGRAGDAPAAAGRPGTPAPPVAALTGEPAARRFEPEADPAAPRQPVSAGLPGPVAAALSERAQQIARLPWAALRESVAACRACTLCESRTHAVFGVGHEQAHWMIVGEAPGENEDLKGEPFVGRAGQLLDNMLRSLALTRAEAPPAQQVFIANTLKCRPPRNRNPGPEELAQCEPYLQRQIALVQPKVLLAMGRFAIKVLLGSDEAIGRLRGKVHRYQGIPVVVSYHPAYLLRQPADKAKAWEDLCLAASVCEQAAASAE